MNPLLNPTYLRELANRLRDEELYVDACDEAANWIENAAVEISRLRTALLLYHEAWNGCEGDWHNAMRAASDNADCVLWPSEKGKR